MASASTRKQCASSGGCKQIGVAHCEGCTRTFCGKHFLDHRRLLSEELNVLFSDCNEARDALNQQSSSSHSHPLINQIDEWEKKSIACIQQKAMELRQKLLQFVTNHRNELSQKLRQISEQSNEGQEHDCFSETDIQQWKETLESIKSDLGHLSTLSINQHIKLPLVQNISINFSNLSNDLFEQTSDDRVRIEDGGQVAIHDATNNNSEIRGKNEYTSGLYKIRLCIEKSSNIWMLLGIISKSTALQRLSYNSQSTYGWSSNNNIWLNGQKHKNHSNQSIEMKKNDIISLVLDCNKGIITMFNERTKKKHELFIDLTDCPLPWQLHVNLYDANSRVRILPN